MAVGNSKVQGTITFNIKPRSGPRADTADSEAIPRRSVSPAPVRNARKSTPRHKFQMKNVTAGPFPTQSSAEISIPAASRGNGERLNKSALTPLIP
ncbi:hypothetical protein EVAR_19036_1 [Eumeta japonica]|uniref:Uncharacterized protein n=1 Tax=Eumeta variegata TaxID=151549 RepID=A0A4C1VAI1_EUMVA|nr:hypothetical protein EVAR_19036_1 [Eumeta japonica]